MTQAESSAYGAKNGSQRSIQWAAPFRSNLVFVVSGPIWITVDAGAGGLATDHRWVPQLKRPGPDWLGKNLAARCAACAGVVDLGRPIEQYDRCVRSAFNAVIDWCGSGVS